MTENFEPSFTYILKLADNISLQKDYYEEFETLLSALGIFTEEPLSELYDANAKRFHNLTIDALWAVFHAGKISEIVERLAVTKELPVISPVEATCDSCNGAYGISPLTSAVTRRSNIVPSKLFCTPECLIEYHSKIQPEVARALFDLIDIKSENPERDIREMLIADLMKCDDVAIATAKLHSFSGMSVNQLSTEYLSLIS